MLLISMKMYPAFLRGIFFFLVVDSMTTSAPETNNITSTAEPNKTTRQLTTVFAFYNETESQPATWESTHKLKDMFFSATAKSTEVTTVENEEAVVGIKTNSSNEMAVSSFLTSTPAAATSSSMLQLLHTLKTAGETQPTHNTAITETAKHTEDRSHQQSTTSSTDMTAPLTTSAASPSTVAMSSSQPTTITETEITSESSSTISSRKSTAAPVVQNLTTPSASPTTTVKAEPMSETTHASGSTFLPSTTDETPKTSTEISSTPHSTFASRTQIYSQFTNTTEPNATSVSTESPNSTTAVVVPVNPHFKQSLNPKSKSVPATTAPTSKVSKAALSPEVQPCSTRDVVKRCFIIIASLAVLATIFIFSTIILCAKLSARNRKVRKPQQATEMMCISSLLPERNYTYTRQRNPVTNGVLVIPRGEDRDSDEDVGDNLTLSSFLPESDRFV